MLDINARLEEVLQLPVAQRTAGLTDLCREVSETPHNGAAAMLAGHAVDHLDTGVGTGRERLELGELLGVLGDPRIVTPADDAYWVTVASDSGEVTIGRYQVTNHEFQLWVDQGGYDDPTAWSDEGQAWLGSCKDPWWVRATAEGSRPFVVANQPVVGVTIYEAEAYARAMGARLPRADERVWVTRGAERRPYPWGSPFGEGNANTREEVLGRPCAVGLYVRDRTPEGVCDLAGNAAEWTADGVGAERLIHPGAWDQPSMAAWAKALALESPSSRWAGLGFRLAKD